MDSSSQERMRGVPSSREQRLETGHTGLGCQTRESSGCIAIQRRHSLRCLRNWLPGVPGVPGRAGLPSMQGARGVPGLRWGREGALLRRRAGLAGSIWNHIMLRLPLGIMGTSHIPLPAMAFSPCPCPSESGPGVAGEGRGGEREAPFDHPSLHSLPTSHLARWRAAQPLHRRLTTSATKTTAVPSVQSSCPRASRHQWMIWRSRLLGRRLLLHRAVKQPPPR